MQKDGDSLGRWLERVAAIKSPTSFTGAICLHRGVCQCHCLLSPSCILPDVGGKKRDKADEVLKAVGERTRSLGRELNVCRLSSSRLSKMGCSVEVRRTANAEASQAGTLAVLWPHWSGWTIHSV
ncbi:predicted protein [Chaetomium globosum CBS 148.51]|uniref:Uncharacterized protein n=1 Tax=Chaetomium globosum (strain ATCC 6205 / CBS 148.51 / DSM 1962 / NBRC 6347 / NRRL 1970) TaxID=306901 RepID=Q2H7P1_CHAGB|nr:uncharacterized protein CHGG_05324 [Chaetomium globosum CBS 148.51]EAQ88705.1 predicted protein [Chaetomium globosum CBS 148.51]